MCIIAQECVVVEGLQTLLRAGGEKAEGTGKGGESRGQSSNPAEPGS